MFWLFITATVLVALAELGDKTQMLTLVLAARYSPRQVLLGVLAAVLVLQALAVAAGGAVGALLPAGAVAVAAGALFIVFGIWTWRGGDDDDDETAELRSGRVPVVLKVAAVFFVAELGDKTQLLTMSVAADPGIAARSLDMIGVTTGALAAGAGASAAVWAGSTAGMMLVNGLAVVLGASLAGRLSPRLIARLSGGVFIVFGILSLVTALFAG